MVGRDSVGRSVHDSVERSVRGGADLRLVL